MDFKKTLAVIALLIGGLLIYNFATTGQLALIPAKELSAENRQINSLEERFVEATHRLAQANRAAGIAGIDTTSDAEAALDDLLEIEQEAKALRQRATSQEEKNQIDDLLNRIRHVKKSQNT